MEDDYLLEDEDDIYEGAYPQEPEDDEEDDLGGPDTSESQKKDTSGYKGKISQNELWLITAYDDIVAAGSKNKEKFESIQGSIIDAATTIVSANPKHTAKATVGHIVQELFQKQGHHRMVNSIYTPDTPLLGEDIDLDLNDDDDSKFNKRFSQEAKDQIARFVEYLASRDLSKDSTNSRNRKMRQLPAFIIFLFSSGMYDLIINCPTMPKEYSEQINRAMEKIIQSKYDIVEDLAKEYEKAGRYKVADRVRKMQLAWFQKEPMEIRTASQYSDLDLTYDDVVIYRQYRNKFTNTSKAITQDVISDLIEVYVYDKGVYVKLKDKTRSDAIADVKQVWLKWAKENPIEDSNLAEKIVWNDLNSVES